MFTNTLVILVLLLLTFVTVSDLMESAEKCLNTEILETVKEIFLMK